MTTANPHLLHMTQTFQTKLLFYKSSGPINLVLKSSVVQKHTRIKMYKTLARPILVYLMQAWSIGKNDEIRITVAEMRFMRRRAGCTK
jgi:hypothetical protein